MRTLGKSFVASLVTELGGIIMKEKKVKFLYWCSLFRPTQFRPQQCENDRKLHLDSMFWM